MVRSRQGRIGFNRYFMLPAKINSLLLPQKRVYFELIYSWFNLWMLYEILKMVFKKITNPNVPNFALFL